MKRGESKEHKMLKEYAREFLETYLNIPSDFIHDEFSIGSIIFDVIVYAPPELKQIPKIGVECGEKGSSPTKSHEHFEKALEFVDSIIWFPYDIYRAPFADLLNVKIGDVVYIPGSSDIIDDRYRSVENSALEKRISYLFITTTNRYPEAENIMRGIRERMFQGV